MRKLFWGLTLCSTMLGGLYFAFVVLTRRSEQEALGILVSLGIVIIPYVFSRCLDGMRHDDVMRVRVIGPGLAAPRGRPAPIPDPGAEAADYAEARLPTGSAAADERHLRRHHGEELHVGVERQARHKDD